MITSSVFARTKIWILNFVDLQLFLTCVSLPILIGWGMPLSVASIIGNLIFMPFLMFFLLVSSLIFFCELLHIPQEALIYLLEKLSSAWFFCMHYGQRSWLFGFPTLPLLLLLCIIIVPFLIICSKYAFDRSIRIGSFLVFISTIYFVSHILNAQKPHNFSLPSGRGTWHCLYKHNQLIVIDAGATNSIKAPTSTIDYSLLPELTKATGTTTIDHLIVTTPGQATFTTLAHLLEKTTVKHIYLVWWSGSPSKCFWHTFFTLKETALRTNSQWHTVSKKSFTIPLCDNECIEFCSGEKIENKTKNIAYPALTISHIIDNKANTLYAA